MKFITSIVKFLRNAFTKSNWETVFSGDVKSRSGGGRLMLQYEISGLKAENEKLKLRLSDVSNRREQLIAFANYCEREWNCTEVPTDVIDEYLESN